ncbi:hypothetical protein V6N13_138391 [Hibiscus sabdariffa]
MFGPPLLCFAACTCKLQLFQLRRWPNEETKQEGSCDRLEIAKEWEKKRGPLLRVRIPTSLFSLNPSPFLLSIQL